MCVEYIKPNTYGVVSEWDYVKVIVSETKNVYGACY